MTRTRYLGFGMDETVNVLIAPKPEESYWNLIIFLAVPKAKDELVGITKRKIPKKTTF